MVSAAKEMLSRLGFTVRDMDAELTQGEPRREDLRLTLNDVSGWQAIVEVKGYPSGTKTNDARQIREHRDRYVIEEGRNPELTVWLSNTYRATDPSFSLRLIRMLRNKPRMSAPSRLGDRPVPAMGACRGGQN